VNWLSKVPSWLIALAMVITSMAFVYFLVAQPNRFEFAGLAFGFSESGVKSNLKFHVTDFRYNNQPSWVQITGSEDAIFCGLTWVDDDSPEGSCKIGRDENNRWVARTGGDASANECYATCLFIEP
jgi:hypothetical protein